MLEEKYKNPVAFLINEQLVSGRIFSFIVSSFSMFPLLRCEDKLLVKKVSLKSLGTGDIVVFKKDGELYTHRLLFKRKIDGQAKLITKGDNYLVIDEPVKEAELLGRAVGVERLNKFINLESRYWKIINLLAGFFFCLEWKAFNFLRKVKRFIFGKHRGKR